MLHFLQSAVVLLLILFRGSYVALLFLDTVSSDLPSYACVELAPYGFDKSHYFTSSMHREEEDLSLFASPGYFLVFGMFFPLLLFGMLIRRAMVLQIMRVLKIGYFSLQIYPTTEGNNGVNIRGGKRVMLSNIVSKELPWLQRHLLYR